MSAECSEASEPAVASYSLASLVAYFLRLGTWGFGGPVALVGYMHRDLVERQGWIAEADYREGLALAQLAPGRWRRSWRSIWATFITDCSARRWLALRLCCRRS